MTLWVIGPLLIIAAHTFFKNPRMNMGRMIFPGIGLLLLAAFTSKAIIDVLWAGHDPIFR
ncbi:MAG: hypothetical protein ACI9TH_002399 [Kiritimatiellia bacterium]|jgi:hypothetical protein